MCNAPVKSSSPTKHNQTFFTGRTTVAPFCTKFTSNTVHSLDPGLGCAYQDKTTTGAQKQFWPDALPASINDSYVRM